MLHRRLQFHRRRISAKGCSFHSAEGRLNHGKPNRNDRQLVRIALVPRAHLCVTAACSNYPSGSRTRVIPTIKRVRAAVCGANRSDPWKTRTCPAITHVGGRATDRRFVRCRRLDRLCRIVGAQGVAIVKAFSQAIGVSRLTRRIVGSAIPRASTDNAADVRRSTAAAALWRGTGAAIQRPSAAIAD